MSTVDFCFSLLPSSQHRYSTPTPHSAPPAPPLKAPLPEAEVDFLHNVHMVSAALPVDSRMIEVTPGWRQESAGLGGLTVVSERFSF